MSKVYLRIGGDYLDQAQLCDSIKDARAKFEAVARELDGYGQRIEASLHRYCRDLPGPVHAAEYPDYVLSLGPRGGVRMERA